MGLLNICNFVLSPCACNFTVVIIESDAVFLLPQVSGREELKRKVQYIQHREWPLTCLPDMVCILIGICKQLQNIFSYTIF